MDDQQQAFNIVWAHLTRPDAEPCLRHHVGSPYCVYLNPVTGNRCAVGALFTPETAADLATFEGSVRELEDELWDLVVGDEATLAEVQQLLDTVGVGFLSELQRAHDEEATTSDFTLDAWRRGVREKLTFIARWHRLRIPEED